MNVIVVKILKQGCNSFYAIYYLSRRQFMLLI